MAKSIGTDRYASNQQILKLLLTELMEENRAAYVP